MTAYYCTYFDADYLVKALALFESLAEHEEDYRVFAICLDELSRVLLERLDVPHVECVPMHDVERHDRALLAAKRDRSVVEYYWTATPSIVLWLLERHTAIDVLTYIDADLYFYSSPQAVRDELEDGSVLIHGHCFPEEMRHLEEFGRYNVGLIAFRNDVRARRVLRWWRERCNEWCRSEPSAGRFADQKYLDEWPIRFEGVRVAANPGVGVAPWNHSRYRISRDDKGGALVDGTPIVFYHFHSLVFANPEIIVPAKLMAYPMSLDVVRVCVLPYARALDRARLRVLEAYGEFVFPFGLYTDGFPTPSHTFLAKKAQVEPLHSAGAPRSEIVLDEDWVVFPGEQLKIASVTKVAPAKSSGSGGKKVLFFSMHQYITLHSVPEAIVAEALKERGNEVITVNCDGVLSDFCISMSAQNLSPRSSIEEKELICAACKRRRDIIASEFGFSSMLLEDYIRDEDESRVQEIMSSVTPEDYTDLMVQDIPVGRYALYEFLLNNKLNSWCLRDAEWDEYKIYLRNVLIVSYAGQRLLGETEPDAVAAYNALYSVNHVFCALAEQRGIPYFTLHAGGHLRRRLGTMTVFKGLVSQGLTARSSAWKTLSGRPVSSSQIGIVSEHLIELMTATSPWVYSVASKGSTSGALRQFFGVAEGQRVLLATMSSADEMFAAASVDAKPATSEPMFPTQIHWITALVDYVRDRSDLFLIVRVHPREFPNKREGVLSKQAAELQRVFADLPTNVRVNWPQDGASLHDVVKITDVGLNAWSTSGIELGMFGAPVVIYDRELLTAYPAENNYVASDPIDYFAKIERALADGWSFENVRKTIRWLSYRFTNVDIDIRDGFSETDMPAPFDGGTLIAQLRKRAVPVRNSELLGAAIEGNLDSHLEMDRSVEGERTTLEEETAAIREAVKELYSLVASADGSDDEWTLRMGRMLE